MAFKIQEFSSVSECNLTLSAKICEILKKEMTLKNKAFLALSGGKSPIGLFEMLSKKNVEWEKIYISLVDERIVSTQSEDSNTKLIKTHLLQNLAKNARLIPLIDDVILESGFLETSENLESKLPKEEQKLQNLQHKHPSEKSNNNLYKNINESLKTALLDFANKNYHRPDIVILGMGNDGHFASLFSDALEFKQMLESQNELDSKQNIVFMTPQRANFMRLSMSLSAILESKNVILYFCGKEKKMIFDRASSRLDSKLPISYILQSKKIDCEVYYAD